MRPSHLTAVLLVLACLSLPSPARAARGLPPSPRPVTGSVVAIETSLGTFHVELFTRDAPLTVAGFLRHVRRGHYAGTIFHRVVPRFVVQGGGYDARIVEKPAGPPVPNEAHPNLRNVRGTVALARLPDPHSGRAQFYVNLRDNPALDHRDRTNAGWGYCVFGKVVLGMDVVDAIAALPTGTRGGLGDVPLTDVVIRRAWVVR
jgi:cyclophilin family peptidyl-prolyl cis-trans isomerase